MDSFGFLLTEVKNDETSIFSDSLLKPFRLLAGRSYQIVRDNTGEHIRSSPENNWQGVARRVAGLIGSIVCTLSIFPLVLAIYLKNHDEEAKRNYEVFKRYVIDDEVVNINHDPISLSMLLSRSEPENVGYFDTQNKAFKDLCSLTSSWEALGIQGHDPEKSLLIKKFAILGKDKHFGDGIWEETKDLRNYLLAFRSHLLSDNISINAKKSVLLQLAKDMAPLKQNGIGHDVCLAAVRETYEALIDGPDHEKIKFLMNNQKSFDSSGDKFMDLILKEFGISSEEFLRDLADSSSGFVEKRITPHLNILFSIYKDNFSGVKMLSDLLLTSSLLIYIFKQNDSFTTKFNALVKKIERNEEIILTQSEMEIKDKLLNIIYTQSTPQMMIEDFEKTSGLSREQLKEQFLKTGLWSVVS